MENQDGKSAIVLVCEHASNRIPAALGGLGLSRDALESHIAWDPGAVEVARLLSRRLDAPLIMARFSRLVFDCNRSPRASDSILEQSDGIVIPGNQRLTAEDRATRARMIYEPFRAKTKEVLASRRDREHQPVLITIHSFTPILSGVRRSLALGVLHDSDRRLADRILEIAYQDADLEVQRNAPYGPEDGVTHTLVTQAIPLELWNVMLEIRNDLIRDPDGQFAMAERLSGYLSRALEALSEKRATSALAGT